MKYYTANDSVIIATETAGIWRYDRAAFNAIVDEHPELFRRPVQDPDLTYHAAGERGAFNSESGQDAYYVLYAHFLKQQNGTDRYAERRSRIAAIYSAINSLYQRLEHGGTYFGHQGARIAGYAEYAVYRYKAGKDQLSKTYDIGRQKAMYIAALRQLVADEVREDGETPEPGKPMRTKELNATIDDLERMITDVFYLRQAQEFQYRYYPYY